MSVTDEQIREVMRALGSKKSARKAAASRANGKRHVSGGGGVHKYTGGLYSAPGARKHPLWNTYFGMLQRCYSETHEGYPRYGGRGITVCERWRGENGFNNFVADMGPKPSPDFSIDRYPNNDGNYEPANVRWATAKQQSSNKSITPKLLLQETGTKS